MAQTYYDFIKIIETALLEDPGVNTVTHGDIFDVDLSKQTIFPLSHIIVTSASYESGVWSVNASLLCMDIIDETKTATDNEDDILNTQLAVITKLMERMLRGDLHRDLFQMTGSPTVEPFTERFENGMAGWSLDFTVDMPNQDIGIC